MKMSQDPWADPGKGLGSEGSCYLNGSANFPFVDVHPQEDWASRKWVRLSRFRLSFIPKQNQGWELVWN